MNRAGNLIAVLSLRRSDGGDSRDRIVRSDFRGSSRSVLASTQPSSRSTRLFKPFCSRERGTPTNMNGGSICPTTRPSDLSRYARIISGMLDGQHRFSGRAMWRGSSRRFASLELRGGVSWWLALPFRWRSRKIAGASVLCRQSASLGLCVPVLPVGSQTPGFDKRRIRELLAVKTGVRGESGGELNGVDDWECPEEEAISAGGSEAFVS
ncbi:hypothetical protein VDBG_10121 [Verticillium alfalfae VaMs.102]|uniref:Uncharacterized protein n=3 Tax=Verticillium TaxID=1036719 RepID=G2X4V9_VERDV|nr:hypothetical protein VDBG_10121 [Verticillium alfalfae VaMs.102]XP_009653222.1 uncharacterized protein VDAG_05191 [Verticillium dahliae VdLs.17]EEY24011.1 hypothetical protein VDBG_10121 [Verticillium alfalfae VaMs.102]EGY23753.1 hypothetical protein VDAG_05191 [Verticillium dahliae VdLs.17]KAH6699515.1 hypothetical protein EV126DRAFT_443198 [Verticillium dahliae]